MSERLAFLVAAVVGAVTWAVTGAWESGAVAYTAMTLLYLLVVDPIQRAAARREGKR